MFSIFSANELDERSYATKRSSANHRTHVNSLATSTRSDKERAFSSCKYQMKDFLYVKEADLFIYFFLRCK